MTHSCGRPELHDKLLLFIEKELPAQEQKNVQMHLQQCAVCSNTLRHLQDMHAALQAHRQNPAVRPAAAGCIPPDQLVRYADRDKGLSAAETSAAQAHIAACASCRQEYETLLLLQQELQRESPAAVPLQGEDAFLHMVSLRIPFTKTAAGSHGRSIAASVRQLLESCRDFLAALFLPPPQPVYVRREQRESGENVTVVRESSRGLDVRIEIEDLGNNRVELLAFFTDAKTKSARSGIRAGLIHDRRDLISLFVEGGKALFRDIDHGTYELVISSNGREIKRIRFETR